MGHQEMVTLAQHTFHVYYVSNSKTKPYQKVIKEQHITRLGPELLWAGNVFSLQQERAQLYRGHH